MKRTIATLTTSVVLGTALAACGASSPSTSSSSTGSNSTAGASSASPAPASSGALKKVAILVPGSINDHGYDYSGYLAGQLIKKNYGAQVTTVPVTDTTTQNADFQQFAQAGYNLVIGWGGQFQDGATTEAPKYPNTDFLCVNCTASNGKNLASVNQQTQTWEFIAGYLLALLSKTNTVGLVGAQCFPATALTMNGLKAGVLYAKPNDRVLMTYDGDFENPTLAEQTANSMASEGAGAFAGNLNNGYYGVFTAAEKHGNLPVIDEWIDNHDLAPKVIASSVLKSSTNFVNQIAGKVAAGTFQGVVYQQKLTAADGPAVANTSLIPPSVWQQTMAVQQKVLSGAIPVKPDTSCPHS